MKLNIANASLLLITVFAPIVSYTQTTTDALNFSQTFNAGTARFSSMGGAFGALGGDFSSIGINPAGLGVYRSSEFSFTPSFKKREVGSDYNGNNFSESRNKMSFDHIGFVFSYKPNGNTETGLVNLNLAIGYNKANDFHTNSFAKGDNTQNSIMSYFEKKANLANSYNYIDLSDDTDKYPFLQTSIPWDIVMAWNTYLLIDTANGSPTQYKKLLLPGDGVTQTNQVETTGSTGEYLFSLGANFSNKIYIGASVGINNYNNSYYAKYSEEAFVGNGRWSNGARFYLSEYTQNVETRGTGVNVKAGVIYKPLDGLRLGVSVHSPTYYNLEDTYSYMMYADIDTSNTQLVIISESPTGKYDYKFETPYKFIGSIAYTFKNIGLLSVDFEHVAYEEMKFKSTDNQSDFFNTNRGIKDTYKNVTNIKVGGEIKIDNFAIRGGYAYYPSPYKKGFLNEKSDRTIFSGGVGYRNGNVYVDAAYQYSIQKEKYVFYSIDNISPDPVSTKMTEGKFLITLGFKF